MEIKYLIAKFIILTGEIKVKNFLYFEHRFIIFVKILSQ
jgi:hypothetical protein